ncbi:ABC transporter substrate-binding protein [Halococcus thailandensis]|uniref:ABC transporter substrate-binding protein n=1 Tax=Halococcus thailandensis JCM 13552 TaxID=1227457 RepID=M0MYQ8_9EURY|nr:extracellular solute-binding protein [Halococcus thailandensis]EMA49520.1 ABC transporter substrate-binding protein [Halococcus thailandensis JCM 13552]
MSDSESNYSRRTYLKGTAAASAGAMVGLAGCVGGGGGGGNGSGGNNSSGGGSSGGGGELQVLHGWTGGDGKKAINNLIEKFEEAHSDVDTNFQAIGGGGNTNLDTTISNRAQNGNLPSSWADWPGNNLVQFTSAGLLGDISDDVWTKDLKQNYTKEAKQYSQVGESSKSVGSGPYVAVPIGSHRMNDLFYNVSVVEEAGVDPTSFSKPSDLTAALKKVEQNTDAVGLAQGLEAPFTTLQLWEVVMQGQAGYQAFMDYINGEGDEKAVRKAFQTVQNYYDHINDDASSIGFTQANQKFMSGDAAFVHNGNWVAGSYRNQDDFEYEKDWNNVTFPGTDDMYGMHLDSFPFPADGPAPEAAKTWLSYLGTTEAQVAFNQYKGSIPPRTDAPTDKFGPYLTKTIKEYSEVSQKPPTIAHGLAVLPDVHSDIDGVITNEFLGSGNLDSATKGMLDAVSGSN